jgi:hypothetical protein
MVEEDEELGTLFRLGLQLFHGRYSGRHSYHLAPCLVKARSER